MQPIPTCASALIAPLDPRTLLARSRAKDGVPPMVGVVKTGSGKWGLRLGVHAATTWATRWTALQRISGGNGAERPRLGAAPRHRTISKTPPPRNPEATTPASAALRRRPRVDRCLPSLPQALHSPPPSSPPPPTQPDNDGISSTRRTDESQWP
ncbi:hypothetical protein HYPSUDRAFT_909063 [Hypholoma sublateritium FD-334 SS-4]|uniref:Uncharacterized protein n=1 Tax=Hypholoma sublateritium (strain FD-334 SS-4) TaxID=945553 RepID=A0A0D2NJD7_HYPSF|nr:hypothetical protein HYPSUDRAFT_909063 [Hypholoma sublateritium FD-334 SS-4]